MHLWGDNMMNFIAFLVFIICGIVFYNLISEWDKISEHEAYMDEYRRVNHV